MLSIIISIVVAGAFGAPAWLEWGPIWGVSCGVLGFMLTQLAIGLILRKKIMAVNNAIQQEMNKVAEIINRKVKAFQSRPGGNPKLIQKQIEEMQHDSIRKALIMTRALEPYFKWNFLIKKQICTMRMMFNYQLKEFDKVDELMPLCMFNDQRALAMKLARMYRKEDSGLDKLFKKKIKKFKGDNCALLYGLYAWILVKQDRAEEAVKLLVEAKKKTDHEAIVKNWEVLANGKVKQFSNAALGDEWYALFLEEPRRIKQQRVRQGF